MKVLILGDVYGTLGQKALDKYLDRLKQDHHPHMIFLNGENIDKGFGINKKIYKDLMNKKISVITMGNHTFRKRELIDFIDESNIIRPINFPAGVPGNGYITKKYNTETVTVINVMGRIFMGDSMNNPFDYLDKALQEIDSDYIFVDVHAEATSEKLAIAHYLDGLVTCVYGTHTHVPTADHMTLPKGTLYVSDIGMTGPKYGILGADLSLIMNKFLTNMPGRIEEQKTGPLQLHAIVVDTDEQSITPIHIVE
jgi:metallophosphoesterase (TIGR00282 family)